MWAWLWQRLPSGYAMRDLPTLLMIVGMVYGAHQMESAARASVGPVVQVDLAGASFPSHLHAKGSGMTFTGGGTARQRLTQHNTEFRDTIPHRITRSRPHIATYVGPDPPTKGSARPR